MPIRSLEIENFTVFRRAKFELATGINVFIGENGTGKSHLLKLLYAIERANWQEHAARKQRLVGTSILEGLERVFQVSRLGDLRRKPARGVPKFSVDWGLDGRMAFEEGRVDIDHMRRSGETRPVFIPPREMLSVFPGFAQTVRQRELAFDDTYVDLADALDLPELKGDPLKKIKPLLAEIEKAVGGPETKKDGHFYVQLDGQTFEAHLVAEGIRKVATIARLIRNGRIAPGVSLFWDEPEANLNPVLLRKVIRVILALARAGVQIFIASHDYLLTQTLSLEAEHPQDDTPSMRFFGLARKKSGMSVEQADTIAGITHNPILDEHARQYDEETAAFSRDDDVRGEHR